MPGPEEMWRVFVAIELPHNVRAHIAEHIDRLRATMPEVRVSWSREDNLHLTLRFLGDIPLTNVEKLSVAASIAASKVEPFEIVVEGCGAFPLRGQPRVLHPHLTLARLRQPQGSRQLAASHKEIGFNREEIRVSDLAVVRSELRSEGSKHTTISRHAFSRSMERIGGIRKNGRGERI